MLVLIGLKRSLEEGENWYLSWDDPWSGPTHLSQRTGMVGELGQWIMILEFGILGGERICF